MRLLPNQIAVLRSWNGGVSEEGFGVRRTLAGGVSVDGYAILFEEVPPPTRFEYRVVNVADRAVSEKLKRLVSEGYRAVAIVAPAILVMERRSEDVSKIDEYRILQSVDAQHVGSELTKATIDGFRVARAGASTTGLRTLVLLEHVADDKRKVEYEVFSSYGRRELEKQLNETTQEGYSPVLGGVLPIIDLGMRTPPQRVELIVGKTAAPKYAAFKVLNALVRTSNQRSTLLYEMVMSSWNSLE